MNRTLIPTLAGVFSSLLCIWLLHSFLIVDDCLDNGGSFDYKTSQCLLENGQLYENTFTSIALIVYVVVGFVVSLTVAKFLRALLIKTT
jgi:uncharacterized membrane protein